VCGEAWVYTFVSTPPKWLATMHLKPLHVISSSTATGYVKIACFLSIPRPFSPDILYIRFKQKFKDIRVLKFYSTERARDVEIPWRILAQEHENYTE
jgi:hypothetical protein